MAGEYLDLSSDGPTPRRERSDGGQGVRKYLGVDFACCKVYARVYVNAAGAAYEGRCPRCGKRLNIVIGPGGTDQRFFRAY